MPESASADACDGLYRPMMELTRCPLYFLAFAFSGRGLFPNPIDRNAIGKIYHTWEPWNRDQKQRE